jgi:hypothetical protein
VGVHPLIARRRRRQNGAAEYDARQECGENGGNNGTRGAGYPFLPKRSRSANCPSCKDFRELAYSAMPRRLISSGDPVWYFCFNP